MLSVSLNKAFTFIIKYKSIITNESDNRVIPLYYCCIRVQAVCITAPYSTIKVLKKNGNNLLCTSNSIHLQGCATCHNILYSATHTSNTEFLSNYTRSDSREVTRGTDVPHLFLFVLQNNVKRTCQYIFLWHGSLYKTSWICPYPAEL